MLPWLMVSAVSGPLSRTVHNVSYLFLLLSKTILHELLPTLTGRNGIIDCNKVICTPPQTEWHRHSPPSTLAPSLVLHNKWQHCWQHSSSNRTSPIHQELKMSTSTWLTRLRYEQTKETTVLATPSWSATINGLILASEKGSSNQLRVLSLAEHKGPSGTHWAYVIDGSFFSTAWFHPNVLTTCDSQLP